MRLEQSLVLNRYFHHLFGARDLEELKQTLGPIQEGPGGDGQSHFFHALAGRKGLLVPEELLAAYDARVMAYEARLAGARGSFAFKYFQYLAALCVEIFLDQLTADPSTFVGELNLFLEGLRKQESSVRDFPNFTPGDPRRLAFFMATGSGKTLLLHVNLWQILHYLENGRHPETLVDRADGRREFDSILLVTPNEGLSQQHLEEFERSGIDAAHLTQDRTGRGLFGPRVKVVEIHKLAEEPSREGVSVLLDELGSTNLVFVDEGHKGTGSEAQTWKTRQRRLSEHGFLLEYSATFAQSIGAAGARAQQDLLAEYGKAIVFDYSYRHFYHDGYGKDFRVLNLARAREDQAHELLLGGLLTYYQQARLFERKNGEYRPYNVEPPLWVFLGSSVNAVYSRGGQRQSDVATVVAFLKRFLEDRPWAVDHMRQTLKGESGFTDRDSGEDLFAPRLSFLRAEDPEALYREISKDVFHGAGGLEVREIKSAEGELGLRVTAPEGSQNPYFGVINIGDLSAFKKHLQEHLGLDTGEDRFAGSLFGAVNAPGSRVNILVGAKKFIEGWSSWRVSSMGLLNIGKGEGPQVIQLFGRGVRLKGKGWSLKRSAALPEQAPHPDGLNLLETIFIFGWNADYLGKFQEMLEQEDIGREVQIQLRLFDPAEPLPIPRTRPGYNVKSETWSLAVEPLHVRVDLTPQVTAMAGAVVSMGQAGARELVEFDRKNTLDLVDMDALYGALLAYKSTRRYGNVYIPRTQLEPILGNSSLYMPGADLRDPRRVQEGALRVLTTYLDRFVAAREREAEGRHLEPGELVLRERTAEYYVGRVTSEELLRELEDLLQNPSELYQDGGKPLPRLHLDDHLFSPLLLDPEEHGIKELSLSPPGLGRGEQRLVKDLRDFWDSNHNKEPYRDLELRLLRNLPRVGVGFFRTSGFYPDFILWTRNTATGATHVQFLEPHGLHHGGLAGNEDKIEALKDLEKLSGEEAFRSKKVSMSGYLLTETELKDIPDAKGKDWTALRREHKVLRQEGKYMEFVLHIG